MNPIQIEENKSSMPSNHSQVLAILEELSREFKVEEKPSSIANQTIPVYEEERKYPGALNKKCVLRTIRIHTLCSWHVRTGIVTNKGETGFFLSCDVI